MLGPGLRDAGNRLAAGRRDPGPCGRGDAGGEACGDRAMKDERRTKKQLADEIGRLRRELTELQAAQVTRRQVIRAVQDRVREMQHPDDIGDVLKEMNRGLRRLQITFRDIGVNLVDPSGQTPEMQPRSLTANGSLLGPEDAWGEALVRRFWSGGVSVYRADLEAVDVYGERERAEGYFGHPVRAVLDVPFSHGTLAINSDRADPFSAEDIAVMEELGQVLGDGFTRGGDLRSVERRAQEAESLASAIAVVAGTEELEAVFDVVVREATRLTSVERASLFLFDEEAGVLVPRAQRGHDWETYRHVRLLPGEDMSGQVFQSGEPYLIGADAVPVPARRAATDALFRQAVQGKALHGGAAVPLRLAAKVIGTLAVGTAHRQLVQRDV
ncbi:GAF domain-containing protein, partial [Myxococcota bacterium]|nr:GAF domain-containing protein [Myxococcota bacterium]